MNRRRLGIILIILIFALIGGYRLLRSRPGDSSEALGSHGHATTGERSGAAPTAGIAGISPVPADKGDLKGCRDVFARILANRRLDVGFTALQLMNLHRANPDFRSLAEAFCATAGPDLVPICKEILGDCKSATGRGLVAALLGHSRRPESFELLKQLYEEGRNSSSRDLQSSAIYSMGLLRAPQSAPFLFKLFTDSAESNRNISEKFGTPLMAAIGLCGKEAVPLLRDSALKGLSPEMQPDEDEGLRMFRWGHLSLVDSPEAFPELKSIAAQDSDIRLRGMAISALGQSTDPEQRAYLADLYARDEDQLIRRTILEALNDGADYGSLGWADMRDRMAGPLAFILKSTRLPTGDESTDYAAIRLASSLGTPEAIRFIEDWIQTASKGIYPENPYWKHWGIEALARSGISSHRMESILQTLAVSDEDRLYFMCELQTLSPNPPSGAELTTAWMEALERTEKHKADPYSMYPYWQALGKSSVDPGEFEKCIDRMFSSENRLWRRNSIGYAGLAGTVALGPLSRHLRTSEDPIEKLLTAGAYLRIQKDGEFPDVDVQSELKALFSHSSLEANGDSGSHFADTVGIYFTRFGTAKDLEWLESLSSKLAIQLRQPQNYFESLTSECARAADAIRLRSK